MEEEFSCQEIFDSAVSIVRNLPREGPIKPSDELKLKFYAYYKQATHGANDTPKPRFYQLVEAYKWDAWRKLADMPKEEAMAAYIGELKQVMESIPHKGSPAGSELFRDVLGQKFYDYWFESWRQCQPRGLAESAPIAWDSNRAQTQAASLRPAETADTATETHREADTENEDLDFQSLSSAGSAGSRSLAQQFADEFAAAILRLSSSLRS